jgi:hypothetical protein
MNGIMAARATEQDIRIDKFKVPSMTFDGNT